MLPDVDKIFPTNATPHSPAFVDVPQTVILPVLEVKLNREPKELEEFTKKTPFPLPPAVPVI